MKKHLLLKLPAHLTAEQYHQIRNLGFEYFYEPDSFIRGNETISGDGLGFCWTKRQGEQTLRRQIRSAEKLLEGLKEER